jgi:hypothetical protein
MDWLVPMEPMESKEILDLRGKMEKMVQEVYLGQRVHQGRGDLEEQGVPQAHQDQ